MANSCLLVDPTGSYFFHMAILLTRGDRFGYGQLLAGEVVMDGETVTSGQGEGARIGRVYKKRRRHGGRRL